jgi:hypothetical protein
MTVSRLRSELTDAEFVYYAAYFEVKERAREKRDGTRQDEASVAWRYGGVTSGRS